MQLYSALQPKPDCWKLKSCQVKVCQTYDHVLRKESCLEPIDSLKHPGLAVIPFYLLALFMQQHTYLRSECVFWPKSFYALTPPSNLNLQPLRTHGLPIVRRQGRDSVSLLPRCLAPRKANYTSSLRHNSNSFSSSALSFLSDELGSFRLNYHSSFFWWAKAI